jgi:hypothetical protein
MYTIQKASHSIQFIPFESFAVNGSVEWFSSVLVAFLFLVSHLIQSKSIKRDDFFIPGSEEILPAFCS